MEERTFVDLLENLRNSKVVSYTPLNISLTPTTNPEQARHKFYISGTHFTIFAINHFNWRMNINGGEWINLIGAIGMLNIDNFPFYEFEIENLDGTLPLNLSFIVSVNPYTLTFT
jgi:hypothetical protein